jgi:hypothetical protein
LSKQVRVNPAKTLKYQTIFDSLVIKFSPFEKLLPSEEFLSFEKHSSFEELAANNAYAVVCPIDSEKTFKIDKQ